MLDILLARLDTEPKKKKLQEEHNLQITIKLKQNISKVMPYDNMQVLSTFLTPHYNAAFILS